MSPTYFVDAAQLGLWHGVPMLSGMIVPRRPCSGLYKSPIYPFKGGFRWS